MIFKGLTLCCQDVRYDVTEYLKLLTRVRTRVSIRVGFWVFNDFDSVIIG